MRLSRDSLLGVKRRAARPRLPGVSRGKSLPGASHSHVWGDDGECAVLQCREKNPAYAGSSREFEYWYEGELMRVGNAGKLENEPITVFAPMPLIRCTMPVPCRVCWYCQQHDIATGTVTITPGDTISFSSSDGPVLGTVLTVTGLGSGRRKQNNRRSP